MLGALMPDKKWGAALSFDKTAKAKESKSRAITLPAVHSHKCTRTMYSESSEPREGMILQPDV